MPTVPSSQTGISLDVPGANINIGAAGIVGESLAKLGSALETSSAHLYDILKEDEARNAADKAASRDLLDMQDKYREMQVRAPDGIMRDEKGEVLKDAKDGTPVSLSSAYHSWLNERYHSSQLEMPSKLAQDMYTQKMNPVFVSGVSKAKGDEFTARASAYSKNTQDITESTANWLTSTPDLNVAYSASNHIGDNIQGGVGKHYDAIKGKELYDKANEALAASTFKGAYGSVLNSAKGQRAQAAQQWLNELLDKSTDPNTIARKQHGLKSLSEMLDPNEKVRLIDEFARLVNSGKELDHAEYRQQMDVFKATALSPDKNVHISRPLEVVRSYIRAGVVKPLEAGDDIADIVVQDEIRKMSAPDRVFATKEQLDVMADSAVKRVSNSVRMAVAAVPEMAAHPDLALVTAKAENTIRERAKLENNRLIQERQKDFAGAIIASDPELKGLRARIDFSNPTSVSQNAQVIQQMSASIKAKYRLAYPHTEQYLNVVDDQAATQMAQTLKDTAYTKLGVDHNASLVAAFQKAYGADFNPMLMKLINEDKLPKAFAVVGLSNDPLVRNDLMDAAMDAGKRLHRYYESGGSQETINAAFKNYTMPYIAAELQMNPSNPEVSNRLQFLGEAVKGKAAEMVSSGAYSSINDAMKAATSAVFGKNRHFIQTDNNIVHSIPTMVDGVKIYDSDAVHMKAWVNENNSPEALKKLGIVPAPAAVGVAGYPTEKFYEVASSNGSWVQTPNHTGWTYKHWILDKDGNRTQLVQAYTQSASGYRPVFIPNSKVLETPVSDTTNVWNPLNLFRDKHGAYSEGHGVKK